MILEKIDFTEFFAHTSRIFCMDHISMYDIDELMEHIYILADANFRCYRANMIVIENRKEMAETAKNFELLGQPMDAEMLDASNELIANMEWVARSVGEYRVSSKARINMFISKIKTTEESNSTSDVWVSDDVVYSIGEMMDRLSIEFIKREDFRVNNRPTHMTEASQALSDRVEKYLRAKLKEIDEKGFYECLQEQRTYDIEQILDELVI